MSDHKLPVFPTRINLRLLDYKEKSAEKGRTLLKRKSDSLKQKFLQIEQEYKSKEMNINEKLRDGFFKLAEAEFLGANIPAYVIECQKQIVSVNTSVEVISGVRLIKFELDKSNIKDILWLDTSGQLLNNCRNIFVNTLSLLVELSALKSSYKTLEKIILSTNRRVNSLEFNIIPKLQTTMKYINSELDEQDREDFFRLKKIQNIKNNKK